MKHWKNWMLVVVIICGLTGCHHKGRILPSATGSIYECVVVMPQQGYHTVSATMEADMPCLPQMEPYFKLSHVVPSQFDNFLKSARNILMIDIDEARYSGTKVRFARNQWSKPQAVCSIHTTDTVALQEWWSRHGEEVREWFVREELSRQGTFLRASTNKDARAAIQKKMDCDILIPEDYMLIKDTTMGEVQLVWCCNNKGPMRRDVLVYSYPYTDAATFTADYLCRRRDQILGPVISASVEGSYMGTEYKIFPPQYRQIAGLKSDSTAAFYAGEVRGLWRIYNGEAMGGPFVSHSRLDRISGRVVTAETFVYAAGQKKRNALRQAEAILYTLTLPEEKQKNQHSQS